MLFVYDVSVTIGTGRTDDHIFVKKLVRRLRVVKTGTEYFTCSCWPEGHYMDRCDPLKVRKSNCFTDLDDAMAEADGRANELVAKLNGAIGQLKAPAEVFDRTQIAEGESIE